MPLPETSKLYLKNHLFSDSSLVHLEVTSPKIVLFRFPNGEVRSFVATQGGFCLNLLKIIYGIVLSPLLNPREIRLLLSCRKIFP